MEDLDRLLSFIPLFFLVGFETVYYCFRWKFSSTPKLVRESSGSRPERPSHRHTVSTGASGYKRCLFSFTLSFQVSLMQSYAGDYFPLRLLPLEHPITYQKLSRYCEIQMLLWHQTGKHDWSLDPWSSVSCQKHVMSEHCRRGSLPSERYKRVCGSEMDLGRMKFLEYPL
jgi:hypothetical protein